MSVGFRQRTPVEYARILWERKLLLVLPAIAISFAIAIVVLRLPNIYLSTTLLTVKPSSIPAIIAQPLSDEDMTIQLNNIAQEVLSRSTLEPLIINANLYAAARDRGEPMDLLVDRMRRRDIIIEINKSRNDITNGFNISFRASSPEAAQQVAARLADKFTSAQVKELSRQSDATMKFISDEVQRAKDELESIDRQRLDYMTAHRDSLPDEQSALVGRLSGLYEQQKTYVTEIGRLREQSAMYSSQISDIQKQTAGELDDAVENMTDPKTTAAWADLSRRESDFEAQLESMKQKLTPKNPDVIALQHQLDGIKRNKAELLDDWKDKIAEKKKRLTERIANDPRAKTAQYNLKFMQNELGRLQQSLEQTGVQIASLEQRVNNVPDTAMGLQSIEREYQSKKLNYDQLLEKEQRANLSSQVNERAAGESIAMIDPPSLPVQPIAPKRPLLMALGLLLGLGVGVLCAAAFEVPRLLTIQTVEDARHYTDLLVLVSVPEMQTPYEQRRRKLRRALFAVAGVAATVVAVPALALLLNLTHVFEIFAS